MAQTTYKILVVDDEKLSREGIIVGLQNIFKNRKERLLIFEAENTAEAQTKIDTEKPHLVLLDIEMPQENGIDFLSRQKSVNYDVIFITAYHEYAIAAFRHHAQDYLLKPYNENILKEAIEKCIHNKKLLQKAKKYAYIKEMLQIAQSKKLSVPTSNGLQLIKVSTILYLKASGSYTDLYYMDGTVVKISMSRNIKHFEQILSNSQFIRIHDAHMVNLNFVEKYIRGDGGYVILEDGTHLDVSKRKKAFLLAVLQNTIED